MAEKEGSAAAKAFGEKVKQIIAHGYTTLGLVIGKELGLFQSLGSLNAPSTAQQIADRSGCRERYIREWLHQMVVSGIVVTDESEEHFYLPPDHIEGIALADSTLKLATLLPRNVQPHDKLMKCFRNDGPQGLSIEDVSPQLDYMAKADAKSMETLLPDIIFPEVPELVHNLKNGITILDVGCNTGKSCMTIASMCPKSVIVGIDIDSSAIITAQDNFSKTGLSNATFFCMDAAHTLPEWENKYDFTLALSLVHDLPYPRKVLAELFRVTKPGGYFSMLDPTAAKTLKEKKDDVHSPVMYGISMYFCLASSLAYEGSEGLGAMAGQHHLCHLAEEAGFEIIAIHRVAKNPGDWSTSHIVCRKPA